MDNQINGFIFIRLDKGMYALVQAGMIAHTALKEHLRPFVCEPAPITTGLWHHKKNGLSFNLVVENFRIKYNRKDDTIHLIHALQEKYEITKDWTGSLYSGITLN